MGGGVVSNAEWPFPTVLPTEGICAHIHVWPQRLIDPREQWKLSIVNMHKMVIAINHLKPAELDKTWPKIIGISVFWYSASALPLWSNCKIIPYSKVHVGNMGPSGSYRPKMGPMLAPWILQSGITKMLVVLCYLGYCKKIPICPRPLQPDNNPQARDQYYHKGV